MKSEELSVWDHLDELRQGLIKSLLAIGCAFVLCIYYYPVLFQFLLPASGALHTEIIEHERLTNRRDNALFYTLNPSEQILESTPTVIHEGSTVRIPPEGSVLLARSSPRDKLYLFSPIEGLATLIKVSLWAALALSSPFWGYFLLQFLAPGLEMQEKRLLFSFLGLSLLFLFSGAVFAYAITLPIANAYLGDINAAIGQNLWSLSAYLDYSLLLILANSVVFEMGLILLFLVHLGICTAPFMEQKRKGVIVGIFVLSAVLTPPDVLTQILMAIPLMLIYEGAILYARLRAPLLKKPIY